MEEMNEYTVHYEDGLGNEVTVTIKRSGYMHSAERARMLLIHANATMMQTLHREDHTDE